ncbi:MAG TPA: acyl-CoA thioesterase [Gammaproteobacteria bacterium]|nr:acyl-CoA thioesterase [Gammaproteobacteria bacterium]
MDIDLRLTSRKDFTFLHETALRWSDFDKLQHLNNVTYHRLHEIVITHFLAAAGLDWQRDSVIPFVVENACCYCRPVDGGDTVMTALRVAALGRTSLRYELAIFDQEQVTPASYGYFTHVFVDRNTGQPGEIPLRMRSFLQGYLVSGKNDRPGEDEQ